MSPADWRQAFCDGLQRQTATLAPGVQQANIAIVPADVADDFEDFLHANPAACPLLARGRPGDPALPGLGAEIDLRRALPLYRRFQEGRPVARIPDVTPYWRDDFVPFAIGCSLSFESDLVAGGVTLRCHAPGASCSAFDTAIPNATVGPFAGNLVVSMRAIPEAEVPLASDLTRRHPDSHGAPDHTGDPAEIGVDLGRPIDGLGLTDIERIAGCGLPALLRANAPFLAINIVALAILVAFPELSLWLPRQMGF